MAAPLVIAHRGVPGSGLEHTRPSFDLGVEQGADYIEPDLVSTKDRVLIVRHENEIGRTTDVADRPEFAALRTTKTINGVEVDGWFTEDFTLEEIKTLRVRERLPNVRPQNLSLEGHLQILTFDEVLDIAEAANNTREEVVGVYVETKFPTYFGSIGIDLNDLLIESLERRGSNHEDAKIIIQSMEPGSLRGLRERTPLPLIQLLELGKAPFDLVAAGDPRTYDDMTSAAELAMIAEYANGIGPHKGQVISRDENANLKVDTGLVGRAHDLGLLVHIWTMRDENAFLPANMRIGSDAAATGDALSEYLAFFDAGVDGVFSDFTATAVDARQMWLDSRA